MKYKLSEFRNNTREAFNLAEQDKVVTIERHGIKFALIREDHFNIQNHNFVQKETGKSQVVVGCDSEGDIVVGGLLEGGFGIKRTKPGYKLCKHGADPKLCKHAQPGKPCK